MTRTSFYLNFYDENVFDNNFFDDNFLDNNFLNNKTIGRAARIVQNNLFWQQPFLTTIFWWELLWQRIGPEARIGPETRIRL